MAELKISNDLQNLIKKIVLDTYYPVGKIYITMGNENPNETIGGTWEKTASGKVLVGVDTNDIDFNTIGKTGGEKTHTLTLEEMPEHNHSFDTVYSTQVPLSEPYYASGFSNNNIGVGTGHTNTTGGSQPHNNLQPYMTVYMWKRTA